MAHEDIAEKGVEDKDGGGSLSRERTSTSVSKVEEMLLIAEEA